MYTESSWPGPRSPHLTTSIRWHPSHETRPPRQRHEAHPRPFVTNRRRDGREAGDLQCFRDRCPPRCALAAGVLRRAGLVLGSVGGAHADLKAQVGATDAELGLALLFAGMGAIPAMLVAGRLWRRLGWWMLPICGVIFAATIVGPIFATTPVTLALFGAFAGAGSGALDVSMNAAVSDVEAERGTRLMFGAHAMFSLAVLLSAVATGLARQVGAGPAPVLVVVAVFVAVVAIGSIGTARVSKRPSLTESASGAGTPTPGLGGLAFLAALCAAAFLVEDAVQTWSALHIEGGLGATPAVGGAAPGVFAGAMFIGRVLGQRFGDRFSERMLLSGGALVAAAGTACSRQLRRRWSLWSACSLPVPGSAPLLRHCSHAPAGLPAQLVVQRRSRALRLLATRASSWVRPSSA